MKVWEVAGGSLVKYWNVGARGVYTIDFDAAGKRVFASLGDGTFRAWDIDTTAEVTFEGAQGFGQHIWDVSPCGRYVAGPQGQEIVVWDQKSGRELRRLEGHAGGTNYVTFAPEGRYLASSGADGTIRIWNAANGRLVSTPGQGLGSGGRLRFSRDGRRLAGWGSDGLLHVYGAGRVTGAPPPPRQEPVGQEEFEDD